MKEVVVNPDSLNRQQGLPELAQSAFGGVGWPDVIVGNLQTRLWQGPSVEFAIDGHRKTVYRHIGNRHHISRQFLAQLFSQSAIIQRPFSNIPGDQVIIMMRIAARYFLSCTRQYHHLNHPWQGQHGLFYLCRFNAIATNLDLVISATDVLYLATVQPLHPVAGAIEPVITEVFVRGERVADKGGFVQVRPMQVSTGHTHATYIQFTRNSWRQWLPAVVEHIKLSVCYGAANGNNAVVCCLPGIPVHRCIYGAFARAIGIKEQVIRMTGQCR